VWYGIEGETLQRASGRRLPHAGHEAAVDMLTCYTLNDYHHDCLTFDVDGILAWNHGHAAWSRPPRALVDRLVLDTRLPSSCDTRRKTTHTSQSHFFSLSLSLSFILESVRCTSACEILSEVVALAHPGECDNVFCIFKINFTPERLK
jgi:hypothetical protein